MRGVWVDAFGEGLRRPTEVDAVIDFAVAAGLDTLVVQATRRGDAFANRLPLPRADAELAPAPFDPLEAVCDRAHAAGLTVHAWLAVTPIAAGTARPEHWGTWLCRRDDGTERDAHGIWHLDPGHPDARGFVAELAAAVAQAYPVDGVSLDRVRYPEGGAWGHNPTALRRFQAETGHTAGDAPASRWQAWRRAQVTALVDGVVAAVRATRHDVVVSVNGTCFGGLEAGWEGSRPYLEVAQDWIAWLREQRVDRVLAMDYRGDTDDVALVDHGVPPDALAQEGAAAEHAPREALRSRFEDWARLAVSAGGDAAVVGSGLYLQDVADSADDVARVAALSVGERRAGGWCGFSYRTPSRAVLRGRADPSRERDRLAAALGS